MAAIILHGAIAEMLVQGTADEITVLPALPRQWPSSLKGIRMRGGARLGITGNGGRLTELKLHAVHAVKYRITYGDLSTSAQIQPWRAVRPGRNSARNHSMIEMRREGIDEDDKAFLPNDAGGHRCSVRSA